MNKIDDDLPICLECLGEIHSYQDTKMVHNTLFHVACSELAAIKWLQWESNSPKSLVN